MNASQKERNDTTKRAVVYLRAARADQTSRERSARQRQACLQMAKQLEVTIADEYVDTGCRRRRPQLIAMIRQIKQGGIDYLIVERLEQLTRNFVDHAELEVLAQKHGTTIVSCVEYENEYIRFGEIAQVIQKMVCPCGERRKAHARR